MFLYLYKYNICPLRKKKISEFCLGIYLSRYAFYAFPGGVGSAQGKRSSQPVQAFYQFLIPVYAPRSE